MEETTLGLTGPDTRRLRIGEQRLYIMLTTHDLPIMQCVARIYLIPCTSGPLSCNELRNTTRRTYVIHHLERLRGHVIQN